MLPPVPPEVALWAFFEEHRRGGVLKAGADDGRMWMACEGHPPPAVVSARPAAHVLLQSAAHQEDQAADGQQGDGGGLGNRGIRDFGN
jgi:hypothetical protein